MRFALVGPVHPYRGGIAHHTALLASALGRRHDVGVFSFRRQYPRRLYPGETDRDSSAQPLAVPASYPLDPLYPWTWVNTTTAVQRFRPDLTVTQWWVPFWGPALGTLTRALGRRHFGTAFICHNVLPHEPQPWQRRLVHWTLNSGRALVVHSEEQAQLAQSLGLSAPVTVHPLPTYSELAGAIPTQVEARRSLGLVEDKVLLFFGLVRPYKGLEYLLRAMPTAFPEGDVRLVVAGEFWEPLARYQSMATDLGISDRVTWLPHYIPNEQVGALLAAADAVVLPYVEATQSAVVQLAFGAGRPVITTAVGGLPAAVAQEETGLLVPPRDPEALAAAMARFYREGLGPRMAPHIAAGQDRFAWDSLVTLLEELATNASGVRTAAGP